MKLSLCATGTTGEINSEMIIFCWDGEIYSTNLVGSGRAVMTQFVQSLHHIINRRQLHLQMIAVLGWAPDDINKLFDGDFKTDCI